MRRKDILATQIENLKADLEHLVEVETQLINPKIIKVSEALDVVLLEYYKLMCKRKKNH